MTEVFNPIEHLNDLRAMIREAVDEAIMQVEKEKNYKPKVIEGKDFVEKLRSGELDRVVVIDVREPHEYITDNISGINIPLGEIETRVNEIPKDVMVVVHCKSGRRSELAVNLLEDKFGFDNLYNLIGGLNAIRGVTDCGCLNDKVKEANKK